MAGDGQDPEVEPRVDTVDALGARSFADCVAHVEAAISRPRIAVEFVFDFAVNAIPAETIAAVIAPPDW